MISLILILPNHHATRDVKHEQALVRLGRRGLEIHDKDKPPTRLSHSYYILLEVRRIRHHRA